MPTSENIISVVLDLKGKTKTDILLNIALFAKEIGLVNDETVLYEKFIKREMLGTTGIGNGIAFPEACWIEMSQPHACILCRTKEPIGFDSLDGKPVRIILAALGRDREDYSYLKPAALLVRLLKEKDFLNSFLNIKELSEVYAILEMKGLWTKQ